MATCASPVWVNEGRPQANGYPCGRCMPCRITRRQKWAARILLESRGVAYSTFLTLTYRDNELPVTHGDDGAPVSTLWREHLCLFFKRLRHHVGFRYFACGEYGTRSGRPHYHAVVFGPDPIRLDDAVGKMWGHGFHSSSLLNPARAEYVASYTTKKLTSQGDERLHTAQEPEFAWMSRDPPIGTMGVSGIVDALTSKEGARYIAENKDVPRVVRMNGKKYPLDRTMLNVIRCQLGVPELQRDRDPLAKWENATAIELEHAKAWDKKLRIGAARHGTV